MTGKRKRLGASAGAVSVALGLALAVAGAAWAAQVQCEPGSSPEEPCRGTIRADAVTGTDGDDFIRSLAGADTVTGGRGVDIVQGGQGPDVVRGRPGDDVVFGGEARRGPGPFTDAADDLAFGGAGDDLVLGGYGQGGRDEVFGGEGDDGIQTAQRGFQEGSEDVRVTRERIDCGPGEDTVLFDQGLDTFVDRDACENLEPVPPGGGTTAGTPTGARGLPELPFE